MAPTLYELKRAVLTPRTVYKRWRERDMDPRVRPVYEQNYYRRPVYEFTGATIYKPDLLYDLPIDDSAVVLDVGAFWGDWTTQVVDRYGATVHAFEPAPPSVRRLERRFGDDPRVHVHGVGLGARDERLQLALSGPASSVYAQEGTFGATEVEIRDVAAVLNELGLDHIDVCKINIEGGEYDLLDRLAATGWLARIDHVLVQFHEWHPRAYQRRWRNRRALARTHDEVWCWSWIWEYWRRRPIGPAVPSATPGRRR